MSDPDRLVEIERRWATASADARGEPEGEEIGVEDIDWLITEVKKLRDREEELLRQLAQDASENALLERHKHQVIGKVGDEYDNA